MKKSTQTAIMYGVIIVLFIAIGVVTVKLATRKIIPQEEESSSSEIQSSISTGFYQESSEETDKSDIIVRVRITDDNVNVRVQPSTDAERLGSAYYGNTFDYVSQSHTGWTRITYDGQVAYVYSDYVELVPMVLTVEGGFSDYMGADAPTMEEMIIWEDTEGGGGTEEIVGTN